MKTTKLKEVQIFSNRYTITLMKHVQKETERYYSFTSYEIWESNNEFPTFETDDLATALNKFDKIQSTRTYIDTDGE